MQERNITIDAIKTIAMYSIIALHTFCLHSRNSLNLLIGYSSLIGIPLFFMVSGYLLLARKNVTYGYSAMKIYKILRFIFTILLLWFICFTIFSLQFHPNILFMNLKGAFVQSGPFSVFWYLGSMIFIYICLPFLSSIYNENFTRFCYITFLLFIFEQFIFTYNILFHYESNIYQIMRIWNWLFYFMMGGVICKMKSIFSVRKRMIFLMFMANYLYTVHVNPLSGLYKGEYYYSSIPLMFLSILFFFKITSLSDETLSKYKAFILFNSRLFLPIYTVHYLIIRYLLPFVDIWCNTPFSGIFNFVFVSIVSVTVGICITKISLLNKIFKL